MVDYREKGNEMEKVIDPLLWNDGVAGDCCPSGSEVLYSLTLVAPPSVITVNRQKPK